MSRKSKDYANSCVYRIVSRDTSIKDCYVGSTTNLENRRRGHKCCCTNPDNKNYNFPVYVFIRENGGWDAWQIVQIEAFPCANKEELRTRERYHIEQLGAQLNFKLPTRTKKEYYEDNKEATLEWQKQYARENKEAIAATHHSWYESHKDQTKARVRARAVQIVTCECGIQITLVQNQTHE